MNNIYTNMWKSFSSGLESGNYDIDLNISDINDSRRGISILGYIDENNDEVGDNINSFIERVMSIEPEQYGYPVTELHLTLRDPHFFSPELSRTYRFEASYG
ncbi:hypothetical protein [uncultured Vibrio sp.]|uniref:hypothetical protein n=1 Tax=uncultured Vibrio sp. TaxID=114054 RepID=UPI002630034F|nr:hypothetical protein [uncultured Vibrio sp.]